MKDLTEAEAATVSLLLGTGLESQALALRRAALSRSTFSVARRKAAEEGWVRERVIPSRAFGGARMVVALARPFTEAVPRVAAAWSEIPSAVHLLSGMDVVFGIFLVGSESEGEKLTTRLAGTESSQNTTEWSVVPGPDTLPVYFDYEGVWSHITGRPAMRYPRGYPGVPEGNAGASASPGLRKVAGEISRRALRETREGEGGGQKFGPGALPRSWRRLILNGYLDWRTLPDFAHVPPFRGLRLSRIAWLHGTLREEGGAPAFFQDLVEQSHVYPFLYVVEDDRILLGAMGREASRSSTWEEERTPVLPTVQRHLSNVSIIHLECDGLRVLLDHRYDRMFPDSTD